MLELVKVVRPVHADGEYVVMHKGDMVEGDKLYVDPVEAKAKADANKPKGR